MSQLIKAIYVPGFAYHGHHIYVDDRWVRTPNRKADIPTSELEQIAGQFGKSLLDFPYPQKFCEWFADTYPEGVTQ